MHRSAAGVSGAVSPKTQREGTSDRGDMLAYSLPSCRYLRPATSSTHQQQRRRTAWAHKRACPRPAAVPQAQNDWTALASAYDDELPAEADPDFQAAVNEVCNKALRAMMREDLREVAALHDDINEMGAYFAQQRNLKAALFSYVLLRMTSHVVPKEAERLEGVYKAAYEKLYTMLEDSGWSLQAEGEEEEEGTGASGSEED